MDVLDSYKIDLKNMRTDVAEYQFALDDAFFEAVEGTLVKSGKADADLKIRESGGAYVFTFHIKGTVHVPCDRCLDDMDVEIETERMLTVKLGDEYADEGDMMILPYEDAILNVAWIIYEFIVLEVPLTHVHEPGHCNVEMMEALAAHLVTSSEKPDGSEEEKSADEESDPGSWSFPPDERGAPWRGGARRAAKQIARRLARPDGQCRTPRDQKP